MQPERHLSAQQARVARVLGPLDGERVPGGCEDCDAYQEVTAVNPGVWSITVHHDDDCPFLAAYEGRAA